MVVGVQVSVVMAALKFGERAAVVEGVPVVPVVAVVAVVAAVVMG
jgi:hypothetical protein